MDAAQRDLGGTIAIRPVRHQKPGPQNSADLIQLGIRWFAQFAQRRQWCIQKLDQSCR